MFDRKNFTPSFLNRRSLIVFLGRIVIIMKTKEELMVVKYTSWVNNYRI